MARSSRIPRHTENLGTPRERRDGDEVNKGHYLRRRGAGAHTARIFFYGTGGSTILPHEKAFIRALNLFNTTFSIR